MAEDFKSSMNNKGYLKNVKRVFISSTLIASMAVPGSLASASELPNNRNSYNPVAGTIQYNDFKNGQYWSQDMLWAIDKGIISGYQHTVNPANPKNKEKGNWLNPYGDLSEAQMLSIIFRYMHPQELDSTKPLNNWWAAQAYQLASKYKVPTVGSIQNQSKANGVVTRGKLARAMATLHFGKEMSLKDSVQFMYDAGLSSGKNASQGLTYDNYGVDDKLARAHMVSFMKRYDTFLSSGGKVTQPTTPSSTIIAPSENNNAFGLTVQYGSHTYASRNQAEYDEVMSIVQAKITDSYDKIDLAVDEDVNRYYHEYLDGARGIRGDRLDPVVRERRNTNLLRAESTFGGLVNAGYSKEAIIEIDKGISIAKSLSSSATIPDGPSRPGSAYTLLVDGVKTGYSEATVYSAVFDSLGYKTVILVKSVDGYLYEGVLVEVDGKWVDVSNSFSRDLSTVDIQELYSKGYKDDVLHQK
ncbi:hypothetical protein [Paenibacillus vini]|uniref:SLH domain-containing protein n=1 Tax=Paenibacillus vini TaxID=1476024 RepID=A0ABQ4M4W7_9BACL|nr:hypothetical protein [Paenibacillus vini]GIP51045.1 hypothetical protein J42TS3_00800 [Paenibacillus vini]